MHIDDNDLKLLYIQQCKVDDTYALARKLVSLLKQQRLKISFAESCTGGMLSQMITSIPGASSVYEFGVCVYSNRMKTEFLKVSPLLLDIYGAVSYETAEAMANGLKIRSEADMCVAVTGFAGPTSTMDIPVGTVYVGIYFKDRTFVRLLKLWDMGYDRETIRKKSTMCALEMAISVLENIKDYTDRRIFR